MEGSFLSAAEQRYYPELFSRSDKESSGRVAAQRAMSLFRLSPQLTDDVIQRINELCGAGRLGYYGRSQFYCALKMIAMVQNGLPLPNSVDFVMQAGIEVPLPEFGDEIVPKRPASESDPSQMEFVNPAFNITDSDFTLGDRKGSTLASVPPLKPTRPANANTQPQPSSSPTNVIKGPSSPPVSPGRTSPSFPARPVVSPARTSGSLERNQSLPTSMVLDIVEKDPPISRLEKQTSAPPAPTLTKTEEGWASFEKAVEVEEDEGPDRSWVMYTTGGVSPSSSCSSVSAPASSHHTSESPIDSRIADSQEGDIDEEEEEEEEEEDDGDEEEEEDEKREKDGEKADGDLDDEDVWSINNEQREYYSKQFKMLQPDPMGLLPGGDAKGFFEKSKLATEELSKIWQLSDVNKDGTLSLEEFCTAMHLVVLRKHHIPLPDELPQCLIPKMPTLNGDGLATGKQATSIPAPGSHTQPVTTTTIHPIQPHVHTGRSVTPPSSGSEMKNTDDNWATFVDSPFPGPPSPSSQPPVSFDFASISPDPDAKIFQPIALHLSPDGKPVQPDADSTEARPRTFSDPVHPDESEENSIVAPSPIKPRAMTMSNSTDCTPAKIAPPPEWGKGRSKFGSAAPTRQTGEGHLEQVAPHPRIPRNRSSDLEEDRSHTGATISVHTQGRLPLHRQGAVTMETGGGGSTRGPAPSRPPAHKSSKSHPKGIGVDRQSGGSELDIGGPRRASVPTHAQNATLVAAPHPYSKKNKGKAPHPSKSRSQDTTNTCRRQLHEATIVDSRSTQAYAGSTLPRPRLTKSMNAAMSKDASLPPRPQPLGAGVTAPPLPPRTHQRNHSRSSSLDLNLVFQDEKTSSVSSPRPVIPPRPTAQQVQQSKTLSMDISSTDHDFADFTKFEAMKAKSSSLKMDRRGVSLDYNNKTDHTFAPIPPPRPSASEEDLADQEDGKLSPHELTSKERHLSGDTDADKKREQFSKDRKRHLSAPVHLGVAEIQTGDRKSIQARIRGEKEENTKLSRHNSEMQQELRALTDQRLALEITLERLRPFTSS